MKTILLCLALSLVHINSFKIQSNPHIQEKSQQNCNITNYDFMTLDYLSSRLTWVSNSLTQYQGYSQARINNTFYQTGETSSYEIENVKMTLKWIDDNLTTSFGQNQIITFEGGKVQATLDFVWISADKSSGQLKLRGGQATAKVLSKELPFAISVQQQSRYGEKYTGLGLFEIGNITFSGFNITDIDCGYYFFPPCEATGEDVFVIKFMIENALGIQTVKTQMEKSFNENFRSFLNWNICCTKSSLNYPDFTYSWKAYTKTQYQAGMSLTINRTSTSVMIQKTGLKQGIILSSQVRPIPNSKCGPIPATTASTYTLFGIGQQYISFTIFQNLLREGIRQTQLNTRLNRDFWATKSFRYTVQDLQYILDGVLDKFPRYSTINGSCEIGPNDFRFVGEILTALSVEMVNKCHLNVSQTKLIEFTVNFKAVVEPKFFENYFDIWMLYNTYNVTFNDNFGFKLLDADLADTVVKQSLDRLYENKLFGSGWPYFLGQKKPWMYIRNEAVLLYDRSSIPKMEE